MLELTIYRPNIDWYTSANMTNGTEDGSLLRDLARATQNLIVTDPIELDHSPTNRAQVVRDAKYLFDGYFTPKAVEALGNKTIGVVSVDLLRCLHYLLLHGGKGNNDEKAIRAGQFRDIDVISGTDILILHPDSSSVKELMEVWANSINTLVPGVNLDNLASFIGWLRMSLISIHPFEDGNGRASTNLAIIMGNIIGRKLDQKYQDLPLLNPNELRKTLKKLGIEGGIEAFYNTDNVLSYSGVHNGKPMYHFSDLAEVINGISIQGLQKYHRVGEVVIEAAKNSTGSGSSQQVGASPLASRILHGLESNTQPYRHQ